MTELAARKTPLDAREVAMAFARAHVALGLIATHGAIVLLTAQSAHETARWQSCICYALGGAKYTGKGDWCSYGTTEGFGASQTRSVQRFRAFASLDEAAIDQLQLLRGTYPHAWAALPSGECALFVAGLHAHGYFTGDPIVYSASVCSLAHEYAGITVDQITEADRRQIMALVGVTLAAEPPEEEPRS